MIFRFTALFIVIGASLFLQNAADPILTQNRKIADWPSVDAEVKVRIPEKPRQAGVLSMEYRYAVGEALYRTTTRVPRTEDWAPAGPGLIRDGQASYNRRGYYDPSKPSELFFPKAFGFRDYWPFFLVGPLMALAVGTLALRRPGRSRLAMMNRSAEKGWYRLAPKYAIRQRAIGAWIVALVCNLFVSYAALDYFTKEPRTRSTTSNILVGAGTIPGFVTIGLAVYYTWLGMRVKDARVSLDTERVTPGSRIAAKVELPVRTGIDLQRVVVSLKCVRMGFEGYRGRFRERVMWEQRIEREIERRAKAGGRIVFEQRFVLPADAPPASASGPMGPWVDWEIDVEFHIDNGPDYRGKFQLAVVSESPV